MLIKLIIIALLLIIIINLVRAAVVMLRNPESGQPMSRFLGRRVMFSALVLLLILLAQALGLITINPRPY